METDLCIESQILVLKLILSGVIYCWNLPCCLSLFFLSFLSCLAWGRAEYSEFVGEA